LCNPLYITKNPKSGEEPKFLDNCLSSLVTQTYRDFEVIVVDNGSSDDSPAYIRERYPSVILVENGTNLGFAGGTNAGIRIAKGEFILTLNNDTIAADPHLLEEIVQPMLSDAGVGSCGAKMLFPDGRINSTAICISRSGSAWDRGMGEPDHGQYDVAEEIFGPCAGAALYRRPMLDEIGLFDEDFFFFLKMLISRSVHGLPAGNACMCLQPG
jgi:GT2 family glycosyltransferase